MTQRLISNVLIAAASAGSLLAQSGPAPRGGTTTDVPVAKVVLFSSGVGYFEHAGVIRGNGTTELRFKTTQINDILKSIVLQDEGGGRVGAITYPSQDPLAKTLKSFQVDITQNPGMALLLNGLRGARITVQSQAERVDGTILGVESRQRTVSDGKPVDAAVLNLLSGATIRSIDLGSISSLTLDDPGLQDELTKALAALAQARDQDKKPVTINFAGSGERRVRIGYVVETPVWKTSYRLLLGEKNEARLQGWAIVENQTESDWNDVSLSLVSGRPISFIMDLYQPLYATRPTVVPELFAGLHPQVYGAGIDESRDKVAMTPSPTAAPASRGAVGGRRIGYNADGTPSALALSEVVVTSAMMDAGASVSSVAAAGKMGELFQYSVGNVTLPRQKSAMLPIITDSVAAERVSIYNAAVLASNPLNGVRLKNTTGKHLLQGPITVLDNGGYAGDARIDNVPAGQERLLSYGIDLDVTMDNTLNRSSSSVETARIDKGLLIVSRKLVSSQEYAADNKSRKEKTLVIEHPLRYGWKLVNTQKPFETTASAYRFMGTLAPGKITTLVVNEENIQSETIAMTSADVAALVRYSTTGEIPKSVRDAIGKAIAMKQAVLTVESQITAHSAQINDITVEQNRIRENMKTVASSTQYYERLLAKLNEQESSIENLQRERDALVVRRGALRAELESYLNGLTVG